MKGVVSEPFVLDASIALAWCLRDERTGFTEAILDAVSDGTEVITPAIWPLELTNGLLVAERRRRVSAAQVAVFLDRILRFLISVEPTPAPRAFGDVLSLARLQGLTAYDAAYLELASRRALPLATLDDQLKRAAKRAGIPLI